MFITLLLVLGRGVFSFSSDRTGGNEKNVSVSRRSTRTGSDAETDQSNTSLLCIIMMFGNSDYIYSEFNREIYFYYLM